MKTCAYGREPLDVKLMCLLLLKRIGMILVSALAGGILVGGTYFVTKVLPIGVTYEATTTYYVEYVTDPVTHQDYSYINGVTWDTVWVKSDAFLEQVCKEAADRARELTGQELTAERLKGYLSADLPSDLRIPTTTVTTEAAELTMLLADAVEQAMIDLPKVNQEILEIRVMIHPTGATETVLDNRTWAAAILGCILGLFLAVTIWVICYFLDDSVYVPTTFEVRYQMPMLGTLDSPGLSALLLHDCEGKTNLAVLGVDEETDMTEVADRLKNSLLQAKQKGVALPETNSPAGVNFVPMPGLAQCPEVGQKLAQYDGVILGVQAGAHDGKRIEQLLRMLEKLEVPVTAAVLLDAEEWLQKAYYFPGYRGEKA